MLGQTNACRMGWPGRRTCCTILLCLLLCLRAVWALADDAATDPTPQDGEADPAHAGKITLETYVLPDYALEPADVTFTLTVRLADTNIDGTYGDLRFEDGAAVATMHADECVEAQGLPIGTPYVVEYEMPQGYQLHESYGSEDVVSEYSYAGFTFRREGGDLKIWLLVEGAIFADIPERERLATLFKVRGPNGFAAQTTLSDFYCLEDGDEELSVKLYGLDEGTYTVTVEASEEAQEKFSATYRVGEGESTDDMASVHVSVGEVAEVTVTNHYESAPGSESQSPRSDGPPTSAILAAKTQLEGRALASKEFLYKLYERDGDMLQVKANDASGDVVFAAMEFRQEGSHHYDIRQVEGSLPNVTYDTHVASVEVEVRRDEGTGELVATVHYDDASPATFVNAYTRTPVASTGTASQLLESLSSFESYLSSALSAPAPASALEAGTAPAAATDPAAAPAPKPASPGALAETADETDDLLVPSLSLASLAFLYAATRLYRQAPTPRTRRNGRYVP